MLASCRVIYLVIIGAEHEGAPAEPLRVVQPTHTDRPKLTPVLLPSRAIHQLHDSSPSHPSRAVNGQLHPSIPVTVMVILVP